MRYNVYGRHYALIASGLLGTQKSLILVKHTKKNQCFWRHRFLVSSHHFQLSHFSMQLSVHSCTLIFRLSRYGTPASISPLTYKAGMKILYVQQRISNEFQASCLRPYFSNLRGLQILCSRLSALLCRVSTQWPSWRMHLQSVGDDPTLWKKCHKTHNGLIT